jgi:hypothetical protein
MYKFSDYQFNGICIINIKALPNGRARGETMGAKVKG